MNNQPLNNTGASARCKQWFGIEKLVQQFGFGRLKALKRLSDRRAGAHRAKATVLMEVGARLREPLSLGATLALAISACAASADPAPGTASLTVQAGQPGIQISPNLFGIFFEEINCSGDGGIYAELIRNRSFEDSAKPDHWSVVNSGSAKAEIAVTDEHPMSEKNARSLRLTVTEAKNGWAGIANDGYWGIPVRKGAIYDFSLSVRSADGFDGPLMVSLESKEGKVYATEHVTGLTKDWKNFKTTLTAAESDPTARLVISLPQAGTVWLDMVSLFPRQTWKGRPNGWRPDLVEMLNGLKPGFMRFPGGCWVEGDNLSLSYHWKQTIGEPSDRRNQYNIWQYYSTHGLGYHEYLQLCEDLGAAPMFVVNCGMSHKQNLPMDELGPWVQDALDAIEYANGPADSQWGSVRAKNGHPAPFGLKYMEIGNENGGPAYNERYAIFYKAIKEKYPDVQLIANEWHGIPKSAPVDIVDEHYYESPASFIRRATQYDSYDRHGHKVYVGEYAVTHDCGQGNLRAALGEAAFMTGMERNSDVVVLASYAPLFANIHYKKWNPDLINFDNSRSYGTPSYYVQKMFADNRGDRVLPVRVEAAAAPEEPRKGAIGLGTWETQSEYKDIKVTHGDEVLYAQDPDAGMKGWRIRGGDWTAKDGALQQTAAGSDRRATIGDPTWQDYTLTLKARKISGAEGFLILFHAQDQRNWLWWNIGGWGNTRHGIEQSTGGSKSNLGAEVAGHIETNRWYDLRVELNGPRIRCYLDGKLIHDLQDSRVIQPIHTVASRADASGDIILKTVNVSDIAYDTDLKIVGASSLQTAGTATVLTSASSADENTIDQPTKVAPVNRPVDKVGPTFHYTFPANSLTVLRLRTK
jgi:alpha-L-arabinofuranosidase